MALLNAIGGDFPQPEDGFDIRLGDVLVSKPDGTNGGFIQDGLEKQPPQDGNVKAVSACHLGTFLAQLRTIEAEHESSDLRIPGYLQSLPPKNDTRICWICLGRM